jgi:hypothetical protein
LRPPTSALGWFDDRFHFCIPGQPEEAALAGLGGSMGRPVTTRGRMGFPARPAAPAPKPAPLPARRWGMRGYEPTTFWTPLAPADPNVVDARVLAPEAACPATPVVEDEGLSGLGCPSNRYGVSGLGQLPSFGLDSQSLMWIAILGGAALILPKLLKSKKAKSAALRRARAKYRAEEAAIQARYA